MKVAWIGLGEMGLPTARMIASAGHAIRGFDVRPVPSDQAGGVVIAGSPRDAVADCDVLCIAVFSDEQVSDVLTGPEGVIGELKPGAVVAVFTTGSVESIRDIAAKAPAGISVLDTCFSRKQRELRTNKVTLLVGGKAEAIDRARDVFACFAPRIFHVGDNGAGRAVKLVNNVLFAAHAQVAADALKLAEGLGLDRASTATALMECSAASDVMANFIESDPAPILDGYHRYMVKDVAAALAAARTVGVDLGPLPAATAVYQES